MSSSEGDESPTHDSIDSGLNKNTVKWLENYIGGATENINGELLVDIDSAGCLLGLKGSSRCMPDFHQFNYLKEIKLTHMGINGTIPASLCACSALEVVDLGNNMLSGEIPVNIGECKNLKQLCLFNNKITGQLTI